MQLSQSPFPEMREKAKRVKAQAYCPVSLARGTQRHVEFDCPYSGWPTHYSKAEWEADTQHGRYWPRLKEVNEDEHDLRSGRELGEFNLPGPQPFEEAISMGTWDVFFYTRGFPSIDSDRSRRHVSKLLTFPATIGATLHENSPYSTRNQRLTAEGLRSMTGESVGGRATSERPGIGTIKEEKQPLTHFRPRSSFISSLVSAQPCANRCIRLLAQSRTCAGAQPIQSESSSSGREPNLPCRLTSGSNSVTSSHQTASLSMSISSGPRSSSRSLARAPHHTTRRR